MWRASIVARVMTASQSRSFINGILIGTEYFASAADLGAELCFIGAPTLASHYAAAATLSGCVPVLLDPDAVFLAALHQLMTGCAHA